MFSHTLEDYTRGLLGNGFSINDLREPVPIADAEREAPEMFERATRIPTILALRAEKR